MGARVPEAAPDESDDDVIEIWDINWTMLTIFLALETQWRCITLGGGLEPSRLIWTGIDYAAADVIMRRHGIADNDHQAFDDLKLMEEAAMPALNGAAA